MLCRVWWVEWANEDMLEEAINITTMYNITSGQQLYKY